MKKLDVSKKAIDDPEAKQYLIKALSLVTDLSEEYLKTHTVNVGLKASIAIPKED